MDWQLAMAAGGEGKGGEKESEMGLLANDDPAQWRRAITFSFGPTTRRPMMGKTKSRKEEEGGRRQAMLSLWRNGKAKQTRGGNYLHHMLHTCK